MAVLLDIGLQKFKKTAAKVFILREIIERTN